MPGGSLRTLRLARWCRWACRRADARGLGFHADGQNRRHQFDGDEPLELLIERLHHGPEAAVSQNVGSGRAGGVSPLSATQEGRERQPPVRNPEDRGLTPPARLYGTDSKRRWESVASFITDQFLTAAIKNPRDYATLTETLRPVRKALLTPLARVFRDAGRLESERSFATTILIDYASDDPPLLADLLMEAGPKAFASLFPVAQQQAAGVLPVLQAEIARSLTSVNEEGSEEAKDRLAQRQARAAIALVRLGDADLVWPLLRHSADPRLRSFIVNWLNPLGADPRMLAELVRRMGGALARRCRELTSSVEKSHGTRRTCLLPPRATLHPPPRTWPSSIGCLHPPPVTRHPPPKRWMPSSSTPRPQSAAP